MNTERSVIVPKDQEGAYLDRHNLARKVLPNGLTIYQLPVMTEEERLAKIEVWFPRGGIHDPVGKSGMHHLFEHLVMSPEHGRISQLMGIEYNAHTGPTEVAIDLMGTANPAVREFGVWPFLDQIYQSVANPFGHIKNIQHALDTQRSIVIREADERAAHPQKDIGHFVMHSLYGKGNPNVNDAAGIKEELDSIKADEFASVAEKLFVPRGCVVFAETQGDQTISDLLTSELEQRFVGMVDRGLENRPVDPKLYDELNPDLIGSTFVMKGKASKTRTVQMVWPINVPEFSDEYFALNKFSHFAGIELQDFVRNRGLSYGAQVQLEPLFDKTLLHVRLQLDRTPRFDKFVRNEIYPDLQKLLGDLSADDFHNPYEDLRLRASPLKKSDIIQGVIWPVKKYGSIVDVERFRHRMNTVRAAEIIEQRDRLLDIPPAILIY